MEAAQAIMTMIARDAILASIRRSLGVSGREAPRRKAVADRLREHPPGIVPARGKLAPRERAELFRVMVEAAAGSVEEVPRAADVPGAVAAFLRAHNLPMAVRRGEDPRLEAMPWQRERTLEVKAGPSDGGDLAAVSHAFGAIAESGTLMLVSGKDNPTTLNFLPDTHIVVVGAKDIAGDYETLWGKLREAGAMPRTVNWITGPSRSADIEQTLILGAHGPRRLHVMVVGDTE
jgi:L-lactate dehydrogenase complex protein LldG